jgi:hypothetical protein
MPEKPVERFMLQNVQEEQKKTNERLGTIDARVYALGQEVGQLKGSIPKPSERPWWLTTIVAPLVVAVAVALVTAVITLMVKVSRIDGYLADNAGLISGLRLQQNATDPTSARSVADVRQVLETAQKKNFKIPSDVVQATGAKFIQAAQTNPNAWNAALAFIDYRSFLNDVKIKEPPTAQSVQTFLTHYDILYRGSSVHVYTVPPLVPQDEAAQLHRLDLPNKNIGIPFGPSFILAEDGEYVLDGMYMRRVIIRNSRVVYDGGQVVLDDVYFINCTFEIPQHPNGVNFATAFLAPTPSMTFKADAEHVSSLFVQP